MAKLRKCLVLFITGMLFLVQAKPYKKGKCYFEGKFYEPGEKIYTKPCNEWTCIKQNSTHSDVVRKTCLGIEIPPICRWSPALEGIYPQCCQHMICEKIKLH
uniref:Putative 8.9 kDa family member n=1 Tax=Rhipicephalus pulchellus TaxID=72859 RepID=L7M9X7_RHIPC